jgi:hypothetical protein
MADVDGVLQIGMRRKGGKIVGIVFHVMAVAGLGGAAVPATVIGDHVIARRCQARETSLSVGPQCEPLVRLNFLICDA